MSSPIDLKTTSDDKKTESKEAENIGTPEEKQVEKNAIDASPKPPPMPRRPLSSTEKAIKDMKEAFPSVDEKYVKMALIASEGRMDPAFNALLFISDPSSGIEIPSPRSESRSDSGNLHSRGFSSSTRKQLESDEALAKKLARQYERGSRRSSERGERHQSHSYESNIDDDRDELDDIYDSISKNVENVRTKFGSWVDGLAKKITPEEDQARQAENPRLPRRRKPQLFSAFGVDDLKTANTDAPPVPPKDNIEDKLSEKLAPIQLSNNTTSDLKHEDFDTNIKAPSTEKKPAQSSANEPEKPRKKPASEWKDLSTIDPEPVSDDKFIVDDDEEDDTPIKKN